LRSGQTSDDRGNSEREVPHGNREQEHRCCLVLFFVSEDLVCWSTFLKLRAGSSLKILVRSAWPASRTPERMGGSLLVQQLLILDMVELCVLSLSFHKEPDPGVQHGHHRATFFSARERARFVQFVLEQGRSLSEDVPCRIGSVDCGARFRTPITLIGSQSISFVPLWVGPSLCYMLRITMHSCVRARKLPRSAISSLSQGGSQAVVNFMHTR